MKKFISMLAGVVMASSLFAVSAYAANVTATADKTELKVGEQVVVTIDSAAKEVAVDSFYLEFDKDAFTCDSVLNSKGKSSFTLSYYDEDEEVTMTNKFEAATAEGANTEGAVGFSFTAGNGISYDKKSGFAVITFTAKKEGAAVFTLVEDSAGGADQFSGVASTINVTVKADEPPVDNNNYGTAGNEFEGKATKYWTVNYEAGAFTGTDVITLKEKDSDKTATINVTTTDDFDIAGAVSFYVYVIGNDIANVYIVE